MNDEKNTTSKQSCHLCFASVVVKNYPAFCPECGADMENVEDEQVIKQELCNLRLNKFGMASQGRLYLTNRRLFFAPGITSGLFNQEASATFNPKKLSFSIETESIVKVEQQKYSFFKNGSPTVIHIQSGETIGFDISGKKNREAWKTAIESQASLSEYCTQ